MTARSEASVDSELSWRLHPSIFSVIRAVGMRMLPFLIEATLIPTVLFYLVYASLGLLWAFLVAAGWSFACVGGRLARGRAIPGLLVLACLGISVRTGIYLWSSNSFVYFLQPVARTLMTSALFAISVKAGKPLVARFADDFCPLDPDVSLRPSVTRLFRRLTYQWACVNLALAAVSLALLWTVSTTVFVGATTVATWLITGTGVYLTVSAALRTARAEGLTTAVGSNGRLRAYAAPAAVPVPVLALASASSPA